MVLKQTLPKVQMLEFSFWEGVQQNWQGVLCLDHGYTYGQLGNCLQNNWNSPEENSMLSLLAPKKNNCIFTQHVLFGPHSCLGRCIIPHREPVAATSSHLSPAEPQELTVVLPRCSLYPFCKKNRTDLSELGKILQAPFTQNNLFPLYEIKERGLSSPFSGASQFLGILWSWLLREHSKDPSTSSKQFLSLLSF